MTTATRTQPSLEVPAFRIVRGDTVVHERRRYVVTHVGQVAYYPRDRARSMRHGVKLTLRPATGRGNHRQVNLLNEDLIRRATTR